MRNPRRIDLRSAEATHFRSQSSADFAEGRRYQHGSCKSQSATAHAIGGFTELRINPFAAHPLDLFPDREGRASSCPGSPSASQRQPLVIVFNSEHHPTTGPDHIQNPITHDVA